MLNLEVKLKVSVLCKLDVYSRKSNSAVLYGIKMCKNFRLLVFFSDEFEIIIIKRNDGETIKTVVVTVCDKVELFLN